MAAVDPAIVAQLEAALTASSTEPNPALQRQAEAFVQSLQTRAGFGMLLLHIMQHSTNMVARIAAAIAFKNHVRSFWNKEKAVAEVPEGDPLGDESREAIRRNIVDLMLLAPAQVQRQVGEAVTIIADYDFPHKWDYLLQDLLKRLERLDDVERVNAILVTAHSIFKRYRNAMTSDAVMLELKFVLEQFAAPLLNIMKATDQQIDANQANAPVLFRLYDNLFLCIKIMYSLNAIDLPEFFEDHMNEFMGILSKYLTFSTPALVNETSDEDTSAGRLEKVRAAIVEVVGLYGLRYQSDFPMLGSFIGTIWSMLVQTSLAPKNDLLVSSCVQLLTNVVKNPNQRAQFTDPAAMQTICERVILPNLQLRESDLELYEDNPMEYVRKDLEGSDFETRRRSTAEFVRACSEELEANGFNELLLNYANTLLQQYQANPANQWRAKDTAITLIIALALRSSAISAQRGSIFINPRVDVAQLFVAHVQPELVQPVQAGNSVLRSSALKYLWNFRTHLPPASLQQLFPNIIAHLGAKDPVVHTYAAIVVDALLSAKRDRTIIPMEVLAPHLDALLTGLFSIIDRADRRDPAKVAENDHAMRAILRTLTTVRAAVKPMAPVFLSRLTAIVLIVAERPSNPHFNHYLFEALSAIVRFGADPSPQTVAVFEQALFPAFEKILQADITEFMPYVFQILAQLLELQTGEVSAAYLALLKPIMAPVLWEQSGNVPSLSRLLQAYIAKASAAILQQNLLSAVLGIFQRQVSRSSTDHEGFAILASLLKHITPASLQPFCRDIFILLLQRLNAKETRTPKYVRAFAKFLFTFVARTPNGAVVLYETLNGIQPGLFKNLFESIVVPELAKPMNHADRKVAIVGLTQLVAECPALLAEAPPLVGNLLFGLVRVIMMPDDAEDEGSDEDEFDIGPSDYQAVHAPLSMAMREEQDPLETVPNPKAYAGRQLAQFAAANGAAGTQFQAISAALEPAAQTVLQQLMQASWQ